MSDDLRDMPFDRGVDAEELAAEIHALHGAAASLVNAACTEHSDAAQLSLELECAAVRYAEKRDERIRAARQVDYLAIVEAAERDQAPAN